MFFSESGKLLLTAGLDETIRVWHARTLHLVDVLRHDALHPVTRSAIHVILSSKYYLV